MKNIKNVFLQFTFYDRTGIQAYLEKQAQKGWMLEKISPFSWKFRRMEPKKLHFSVTYFPQASVFDPEPSEDQKRFRDFCAHTGWELAASNAQLQIFYNEKEEPIPIETDAAMEVETIHKAVKRGFMPGYLMLLACGLLQGGLFLWRLFSDPIGVLVSNLNLFTGLCWVLVLLQSFVEIITYFLWYKKAKAMAELDGSFVETKSHRNFQLIVMYFVFAALGLLLISLGSSKMVLMVIISIVIVFAITALILNFSTLMKHFKAPASVNCTMTIIITLVLSFGICGILLIIIFSRVHTLFPDRVPVETYEYNGWTYAVYDDELPLTVEDMMELDYHEYSCSWTAEESIFLAQFDAIQRPRKDALEMPDLEYTITKIKLPILYDWCLQELLGSYDDWHSEDIYGRIFYDRYEPIDAAPWGADIAYQLYRGDNPMEIYLICFDDRMIEIIPGWELTTEQMAIIGEKLREI